MFVGGLLYWAHWLYRIYDQADLNHASAMARQEELMERLIDAVSASGAARQPGPNGSAAAMAQPKPGVTAAAGGPALVATATGSNVHRSDCAIVARHSVGLRHLSVDEASGLPMCRICHPGDLITQR
jgi:hypothetical protein